MEKTLSEVKNGHPGSVEPCRRGQGVLLLVERARHHVGPGAVQGADAEGGLHPVGGLCVGPGVGDRAVPQGRPVRPDAVVAALCGLGRIARPHEDRVARAGGEGLDRRGRCDGGPDDGRPPDHRRGGLPRAGEGEGVDLTGPVAHHHRRAAGELGQGGGGLGDRLARVVEGARGPGKRDGERGRCGGCGGTGPAGTGERHAAGHAEHGEGQGAGGEQGRPRAPSGRRAMAGPTACDRVPRHGLLPPPPKVGTYQRAPGGGERPAQKPPIVTMGRLRGWPPMEPKNVAPKLKMPPSEATNR